MSSPPGRPTSSPPRSPAKPTPPSAAATSSTARSPRSPTSRSPSRITGQRAVPMDVDRDSLRKKRAASPTGSRSDADDEAEEGASPTKRRAVVDDAATSSASIDDRPTKRLHGDSASAVSSKLTSVSSSPTKKPSPTKPAIKPPSSSATPAFAGFGMSALSSSASVPATGFSGFAAVANKPNVFGAPATTTTTSTSSFGGGFGAFAASTTGGFSALAASAPTKSVFATPAPAKSTSDDTRDKGDDEEGEGPGDDDDNDDEPATALDTSYQPVVHLEQQRVVTGEEDEITVASERAKLFLPDADGKPKERGIGSVKVNVRTLDNGEQRARVLMRADGVHNVLVNAPLLPGMSCNVNERVLQFGALVDGRLQIHLFRFKTAVPCQAIAAAIRDNVPSVAVPGASNGAHGHSCEDGEEQQGEEAV